MLTQISLQYSFEFRLDGDKVFLQMPKVFDYETTEKLLSQFNMTAESLPTIFSVLKKGADEKRWRFVIEIPCEMEKTMLSNVFI